MKSKGNVNMFIVKPYQFNVSFVSFIYTLKTSKTKAFLTIPGGIDMKHWAMG